MQEKVTTLNQEMAGKKPLTIRRFHIIITKVAEGIQFDICRRIEVAITSLTRNQVVGQPARGFESLRLRARHCFYGNMKTVPFFVKETCHFMYRMLFSTRTGMCRKYQSHV